MRATRGIARAALLTAALLAAVPALADRGGHAPLHFAHPLIAESPSPDNKLRLDYVHFNRTGERTSSTHCASPANTRSCRV